MSSAGAGTTVSLARQPDAAAGRTPLKGGGHGPRRPSGLPWILPAFVFVVGLVYYCIGYTGYISTLNWDGVSPSPAHVGFANYITAFHDPVFWDAIRHTIIFFVVTFCVQTAVGLAFAALLHSRVKLPNLYKVIIFVPVVLAPATMAPIFRQIFSATGQFNTILGDIGLGSLEHPWLAQSSTALPVIMAITIWEWTGVTFILYFAAMTQIDSEILEAARIDGAGAWTRFWRMTVPLLSPTIFFAVIVSTIYAFQSFGAVDILIGNQSAVRLHTNVLIYNIVNTLQVENNPGAAAIMATVLFLITLSLTVLQMRFLERRVHYA